MSVALLVLLAPLIAELLWGSTPFTAAVGGYLLGLPIYGAGALLIRELVRRRHRGWASILLLGLCYGLVEEGLLLQDLFWPVQNPPYSTAGFLLGIDGLYTLMVVPLHAVWSVAVPILLVETLIPARRCEPWLGRFGLVVTGVIFLAGAVLYRWWAATFLPRYDVSTVLLIGCAVLVVVLAVLSLVLLPAIRPRRLGRRPAPSPWPVFAVAAVAGFAALALLIRVVRTSSVLGSGPGLLVPALGALAVGVAGGWWLWSASIRSGWDDRHRMALACGALLGHSGYGLFDIAQTTPDRNGLAVLIAIAAVVLIGCAIARRTVGRRTGAAIGSPTSSAGSDGSDDTSRPSL